MNVNNIKEVTKMQLTTGQQIALDKIDRFLDSDRKIFILTGQTGTGKVGMVDSILRLAGRRQLTTKLMAATGPAAKAVSAVGQAQTIHRSIYQRAHDEVEVNDQDTQIAAVRLKFPLENDTNTRLFVVYGAAMISNQENAMSRLQFGSGRLLDDLIAATGIKNRPAQIIMIGDEFQLPAASVSTPPALSMAYYRDHQLAAEKYELTDLTTPTGSLAVTRHQLSTMIADPVKRLPFEFEDDGQTLFNLDFRCHSDQEREQAIVNEFVKEFRKRGQGQGCVITNNNALAHAYNQQIRKRMGLADRLAVGDVLYFTRNQYDLPLGTDKLNDVFAGTTICITALGANRDYRNQQCQLHFQEARFFFLNDPARHQYTAELITNLLTTGETQLSDQEVVALYQDLYERFKASHPDVMTQLKEHNQQVESDDVHRQHDARTTEFLQAAAEHLRQLGITLPDPEQLTTRQYNQAIRQLVQAHPDADPRRDCKRQKLPNMLMKLLQTDPYYKGVLVQYAYARNCYRAAEEKWPNVYLDFGCPTNVTEHRLRFAYTALSCAKRWAEVRNAGSIFRKFKLNTQVIDGQRLARDVQMATSFDQVGPVTALERSLFAHLQSLCGPLDFTISGVDRELAKYYLLVYLAGADSCRIQFYYSPKVGWTTANLAADREALDHNEAIQKLIAGLRQLSAQED